MLSPASSHCDVLLTLCCFTVWMTSASVLRATDRVRVSSVSIVHPIILFWNTWQRLWINITPLSPLENWPAMVGITLSYPLCTYFAILLQGLLSSTTHPLLLCCFLSQRLPCPLLHILPSWTLASSYLWWCPWKTLGNRPSLTQLTALGHCRDYQPESRFLSHLCVKTINSWKLMTPGKLFRASFLEGRQEFVPDRWAICSFLLKDLLLGGLACPCFSPDLHQVEGSNWCTWKWDSGPLK